MPRLLTEREKYMLKAGLWQCGAEQLRNNLLPVLKNPNTKVLLDGSICTKEDGA